MHENMGLTSTLLVSTVFGEDKGWLLLVLSRNDAPVEMFLLTCCFKEAEVSLWELKMDGVDVTCVNECL